MRHEIVVACLLNLGIVTSYHGWRGGNGTGSA